jgi:hypothetical protein
MQHKVYRITVLLGFAWSVLLPFVWTLHLSHEYDLTLRIALLGYRPELLAVLPSAILLGGAWRLRRWAVPGLCIGALGLPLLKAALGGVPTDAWAIGGFLFVCIALRLWWMLRNA